MTNPERDHVETLLEGLVDSSEQSSPIEARLRVGAEVRDLTNVERVHAAAGEVLSGKYRLVRPLGEGGMGSVWVARHDDLDIEVAVKIIRPDVQSVSAQKLSQRMLQEARAAARLGHPAIVRITDVGVTPHGDAFCVMELLEGQDIGHFLEQRGRLNTQKAVQLLMPIAQALALAHEKGIVHRDLKPENIFLAKVDEHTIQPKLIDFGVAKIEATHVDERITQGGTLLGSPAYMSPEQARGEDVDARGDIWAFSVVLYEMITGEMPFEGKNYHALIRNIIEASPTPITERGVGDPELWQIIERGLAKQPASRWASFRQLGAALARWLLGRGVAEDICGASLERSWLRAASLTSENAPDPFSRLSLPEVRPPSEPPTSRRPSTPSGGVGPTHVSIEAPKPRTTGRTVWLALAGVAVVGALAFLIVRSQTGASASVGGALPERSNESGSAHAATPLSSAAAPVVTPSHETPAPTQLATTEPKSPAPLQPRPGAAPVKTVTPLVAASAPVAKSTTTPPAADPQPATPQLKRPKF
ncbi:MAG: protein kinase [Polyangiaceae bacterium]